MKVLVTRAEGDAEKLAARLAERGHHSLIENLMTICFRPEAARSIGPFLDGVQAVLFTSANGVRAFADVTPRRDFRAFAVGDATAGAARAAGFADVTSAGASAKLVIGRLKPKTGALFTPLRASSPGDRQALPEAADSSVRRAVFHDSFESARLSDATWAAKLHQIDAALFSRAQCPRPLLGWRRVWKSAASV